MGIDSWGQVLKLTIDVKPDNTSYIRVEFTFEDRSGNSCYMTEKDLASFDSVKCEYKAPGIALQILSSFRRLRVKVRGI